MEFWTQSEVQQLLNNNIGTTGEDLADSEEISENLKELSYWTRDTGIVLKRLEENTTACYDSQKQGEKVGSDLEQEKKNARLEMIIFEAKGLEKQISTTIKSLSTTLTHILDEELIPWKSDQRLQGVEVEYRAFISKKLDTLQLWFENLAELILRNGDQLKVFQSLIKNVALMYSDQVQCYNHFNFEVTHLQEKVTQLFSVLIASSLVVEKQPPPVLKSHAKFTTSVRLLLGDSPRFSLHKNPPKVNVRIVNSKHTKDLHINNHNHQRDACGLIAKSCGYLSHDTATMVCYEDKRQVSASFRNINLKRIQQDVDKSTTLKENNAEEEYCLQFSCQLQIGNNIFDVCTSSFPILIVSCHNCLNQEADAMAIATWNSALASLKESCRLSFQVSQQMPWYLVAQALSAKFKSVNGRGLTEENIAFLGRKVFSNRNFQDKDLLCWSQFCKELLPGRSFTFWEWFSATLELTRVHFRRQWMEGLIDGFVGREELGPKLSIYPYGTFLLRFSDSILGAVTVAWVEPNKEILSVEPWTGRDLTQKSLADRINGLYFLEKLYPQIPKSSAFSKYYTKVPIPKPGRCLFNWVKHISVLMQKSVC